MDDALLIPILYILSIILPPTLISQCNLSITLKMEPDTVVAPREAVQVGQNGNYVFTIVDGRAHVQPVVAGRNQDGQIVVTKGLNGGETVVTDGALLLREGTNVHIRETPKGAS